MSSSAPSKPVQFSSQKLRWLTAAILLLPVVTVADYLSGFELQFSIFYLVSIYVATWFSGWRLGIVVAGGSVVFSLLGDLASGVVYKYELVPWWNGIISLAFYGAVVSLLHRLRLSQKQLEQRVQDRTNALQAEVRERKHLEQALLGISEREQRRIGHDLHDSLCQQLTSAALAGGVLTEKLRGRGMPEAADSEEMVGIIEEGIGMARSLARGLAPVELDALGLTATLRELARATTQRSRISCVLETPDEVELENTEAVVHLFRIAQEAVNNAVRHSRASRIVIRLENTPAGLQLTVSDDGTGLPVSSARGAGMGLHIMRHRASMAGGVCELRNLHPGTCVCITVPLREPVLDADTPFPP